MTFDELLLRGINGIPVWIVVAALGVIVMLWQISDSFRRHLPAQRWRIAAVVPLIGVAAPAIFMMSGGGKDYFLAEGSVPVALAGAAGGLGPIFVGIAYMMRFRGLVGCTKGHAPYSKSLRVCPVCVRTTNPGIPGYLSPFADIVSVSRTDTTPDKAEPEAPKADAWLATGKGYYFQLNEGETTIGRDVSSDIRIFDMAVSRVQARIKSENKGFTLYDMGSTGGTFLNGQRVRRPETLKQDDEITMGDGTLLIFITDPEHPALKRSASTGHHTTIHDSRGMR